MKNLYIKQMGNGYLYFVIKCLTLTFSIFLISCSSEVTRYPRVTPNTYLAPDYEDKTFDAASLDIFYVAYRYNEYVDSLINEDMRRFDVAFGSNFAYGVKMFSNFKDVNTISYKHPTEPKLIYFSVQKGNKENFTIVIPDSISYFQKMSKSEFIFLVHSLAISKFLKSDYNKVSSKSERYVTELILNYSIWDNSNGALVGFNTVKAVTEFKNLVGNWPYRSAVIKLAAETFKNFPMFLK